MYFLYIIAIIIVLYFLFYTSKKEVKYFIADSYIDKNFKEQASKIIKQSDVSKEYTVKEADNSDSADIIIELKDRQWMIENYGKDKVEYYPGTNKPIRFSVTTQFIYKKPRIYIDSMNWLYGVPESGLSLDEYRRYVILHEFMHGLGYEHVKCDEDHHVVDDKGNKICAVLYQSTRGCPEGYLCGSKITNLDFSANKIPVRYIR